MDFFILVTGTDAGEREDYMTEKIREYSMNGALIIGVDNGYGNMKNSQKNALRQQLQSMTAHLC